MEGSLFLYPGNESGGILGGGGRGCVIFGSDGGCSPCFEIEKGGHVDGRGGDEEVVASRGCGD